MSKKVLNLKSVIYIELIIEYIICLALTFFVKNMVFIIFCTYVFIKTILMIVLLYKQFDQDQVDIGEVLGNDVANATIFGGIGLIMYDENRNIIWISELFKELGMDIVGMKLLEWQPDLEVLFEQEDVKVIDTKSRKFEVFNNTNSRVLYLKDVTEYQKLAKNYHDEKAIIGYLNIDNYDDTIDRVDEQRVALIQSTVRNNITKWASDYGIVLRRFKSDGYVLIFDEATYHALVNDKFNILNVIKEEADKLGVVLTLSIGIARNYKSLKEMDEMANSAIMLSYSRGGDQVVIKSNNEKIRFFGGNSEASTKNNKVRARVIAKSLTNLIKSSKNVIIMGHSQSDLDSFGASLGVYQIVKSYEIPAKIVVDFESIEDKTKKVVTSLKENEEYQNVIIGINKVLEIVEPSTLLIVVDNHKSSLALQPKLIEMVKNIVVIDHHRRGEEFIQAPVLTYLEPTSSSTVELITELFEYQQNTIKLTEEVATIMYAGMLVDTNYFKARVGVRTFQSVTKLKELGANISLAYEYLEDPFDKVMERVSMMQNAYRYKSNILIAYQEGEHYVSRALLAKVGNELLGTSEIEAVFTIGKVDSEVVAISARSSRNINVQLIMEALGGGGHFSMAACQFKGKTLQNVITLLEEQIETYLKEREE